MTAAKRPELPFEFLPEVPSLTVTSTDIADGQRMSLPPVSGVFGAGGEDISPQLSWAGFPGEAKSLAVTCFDPDAPTGSGFWHWAVADIPVEVTELPTGAGSPDSPHLPRAAVTLRGDAGAARHGGPPPPATAPPATSLPCTPRMSRPSASVRTRLLPSWASTCSATRWPAPSSSRSTRRERCGQPRLAIFRRQRRSPYCPLVLKGPGRDAFAPVRLPGPSAIRSPTVAVWPETLPGAPMLRPGLFSGSAD